jgi:SAM-dependent methyltransferase
MKNSWSDAAHSAAYLSRAAEVPHRGEGEAVLVSDLSTVLPGRLLDLGCGDGRLAALVLDAYPGSRAIGLDFSATMLEAARRRFDGNDAAEVRHHDLDEALDVDGPFDAVVSSLAIHHVDDERKRALFREVADRLAPGGVFCNLDVVASPTAALHERWRVEIGVEDDPSDRLTDVASQLGWYLEAGLVDVDCIWKWRGLALMRGERRPG